ncbi:MAG: adenine deaminase [Bacilli bacterium]|nr:adenine deaminase [Bacilli bacterium]
MDKENLRKVAMGEKPAGLVLKNARTINVFSGTIETADIAIENGVIAGIGSYSGIREIDLCLSYACPGLIDGHVHIESSMLTPSQFARIVVPHGTTTVIADPHEIANVCGLSGIKFMLESAKTVPLDVKIMIPSCVPSTPFETSGDKISAEIIGALKNEESILGLGEMMNYPGVIEGNTNVYTKINAIGDKIVDGHAPGLTGKALNAYVLAGIRTDHESTDPEELINKINRGMYVHLREGSATRNVLDLLGAVNKNNLSRLMFCTDDKNPEDIHSEGHINYNINLAIKNGIDPIDAIKMATINIASCYSLKNIGAIAPGYLADIVVFDSLDSLEPKLVFKKGILVAKNKEPLFKAVKIHEPLVLDTVRFHLEDLNFSLPVKGDYAYVIGLEDHNITTKKLVEKVKSRNGFYVHDPDLDILKLAVVERHHYSGNIGLGLVKGYGLKNGAIAMTIAHDSHNLVIIGDNDEDMMLAAEKIREIHGGIVLVYEHEVYDYLQLEIAGIITENDSRLVEMKLERLIKQARKMGVKPSVVDPFIQLAFLSLPVIPELKLTDFGLFDVEKFKLIDINPVGGETS